MCFSLYSRFLYIFINQLKTHFKSHFFLSSIFFLSIHFFLSLFCNSLSLPCLIHIYSIIIFLILSLFFWLPFFIFHFIFVITSLYLSLYSLSVSMTMSDCCCLFDNQCQWLYSGTAVLFQLSVFCTFVYQLSDHLINYVSVTDLR